MLNQLSFKSRISSIVFKNFLLNLKPKTLAKFTKFGRITSKNVDYIVEKELKNSNSIKFFSFVNNELIAYSFLTKFEKPSKKHNCILGIVLVDAWQKKGFGKKICKHMIKTAWRKNFEKIWLTIYPDNVGALKHKVSMAIFKKNFQNESKRKSILKHLNLK